MSHEQGTLLNLPQNAHGTVLSVTIEGAIRRRLLDIGLIEGTDVQCVLKSPGGDPKAFLIRGAVVALRSEDSQKVIIQYEKN